MTTDGEPKVDELYAVALDVAARVSRELLAACDRHGPIAPRYAEELAAKFIARALYEQRDAHRLALAAAQQSAERYAKECDRLMTEVPAAFQRQLAAAQREREEARQARDFWKELEIGAVAECRAATEENARLRARGESVAEVFKIAMGANGHFYDCRHGQRGGKVDDASCSRLCIKLRAALHDGGAREEETNAHEG